MDNRSNVFAQGDHTHIGAGLVSLLLQLIDDSAYQSNQNTLCLIALNQSNCLLRGGSGTQDNGNTGDIAGNQRNTQLTDHGIAQVSIAGLLIGIRAVNVLGSLNKLRAQSGGNTGHEHIVQLVLSGHQGLYHAQSLFQLFQVGNFGSCYCVVAGKAVSSVGEAYRFLFAVLLDRLVNDAFGQAVNGIISAKNSLK